MQAELNPNQLREIEREIVVALIFSSDGKLSLGMKDPSKGGVYIDCWHNPGGGVEEGEDKLSALRREVLEETNLCIDDADISLIDNEGRGESEKTLKETGEKVWCKMRFYVFSIRLKRKASEIKLTSSDDLVKLSWFDKSELQNLNLTPPGKTLFMRLGYIN